MLIKFELALYRRVNFSNLEQSRVIYIVKLCMIFHVTESSVAETVTGLGDVDKVEIHSI